ncbi:MAG: dienelactone hydrolase family protein [Lautropia sp.]
MSIRPGVIGIVGFCMGGRVACLAAAAIRKLAAERLGSRSAPTRSRP